MMSVLCPNIILNRERGRPENYLQYAVVHTRKLKTAHRATVRQFRFQEIDLELSGT